MFTIKLISKGETLITESKTVQIVRPDSETFKVFMSEAKETSEVQRPEWMERYIVTDLPTGESKALSFATEADRVEACIGAIITTGSGTDVVSFTPTSKQEISDVTHVDFIYATDAVYITNR